MFKTSFFKDLKAGLVVFLVALPLCLGVAMASNAPNLISGLLAGIIGGIVVGSISNSRLSVTGPAAGLTSIMALSLADLGSYNLLLLAIVIAGLIQIILGLVRAGTLSNFFPSAAIKGMLCGIGIILIIKQIPHFFGYDNDPEGDLDFFQTDHENSFSEIINAINFICPPSLVIGILGLTILIIWETKWLKRNKVLAGIPAPLLVVLVGIIGSVLLANLGGYWIIEDKHMVNVPSVLAANSIHEVFLFPDFSGFKNAEVYKIAAVIAAVASIETLLCIEAVDKLDPKKMPTNTNRELVAQGTGNVFSGLIGGLPLTSVIVRSSANLNAGAKTKLATIFHGIFLAISIVLFPDLLKMIPNASLAAILIFTGYKLAKISIFKLAIKQGYKYFIPFFVTMLVMLFTDLLKGVGAGVVVSFAFILIENIQIPFKVGYEKIDGKLHVLVVVSQHVTFLNKGSFVKLFKKLPAGSSLTIDARKTKFMDRDVTELLNEFKETAKNNGIELELMNVKEVETIGH